MGIIWMPSRSEMEMLMNVEGTNCREVGEAASLASVRLPARLRSNDHGSDM